jgi:hypothetical protein
MTRAVLLLTLSVPLLPAPTKMDGLTAEQKIDLIENRKVPPGTQVSFREPELNTYLERKAQEIVPDGLKSPRLVIRDGKATGTAVIDFVKMRHAQGADTGWMMRKLLDGEHPVQVVGTLKSANGNARVDIESLEIGGVSIKGRALDLLIRTFVHPIYPNVKVGQTFELGYNLERIELKPGVANVFMVSRTPKPLASR